MQAEDIVALLIPLTWLAMLAIEAFGTGRAWPATRFWRTRGLAFFILLGTLNALLPQWLQPLLASHHLFDGSRLGTLGGVLLGYPVLALATALLHRAYHRFDVLWRWVHQLHHAPQRLDTPGAVIFTPWEMALNIVVFQVVVVLGLGLEPLAAAIVGYVAVFYGLFQHFNIATPQWLGYLIQRPESHAVHHRRGVHAYNYSDFPLWDLLWGTFRNPKVFNGEVGFEGDSARRLAPLLVGRDANAPLYGPASRGSRHPADNPA
ncbi:MAG: sterol desaturase family protein [Rubrivivax sp.]